MWSFKSWKTLLIFSVIIPMSLFTGLRLSGVLHEPLIISETISLDTVKWQMERPCAILNLNENIAAHYSTDISTHHRIYISNYIYDDDAYGSSGTLSMAPNITVQISKGFITNLRIVFKESYENSLIDFTDFQYKVKVTNLAIINWTDVKAESFIDLAGVNYPKNVSFYTPIYWLLYSPFNQTHQLEITSEITYYNGSVFKKVIQPFQLKIAPDYNDNFSSATAIHLGKYDKLWIGQEDLIDYYKIQLTQGQNVHIEVNDTSYPLLAANFRVYIYDPEKNIVKQSETSKFFETMDFMANSTGYWYIEVRIIGGGGLYLLAVSVQ
jgi:hypothetical protein